MPSPAFKQWSNERGVWPRLTHEEIWNAAIDAAITKLENNILDPNELETIHRTIANLKSIKC